MSTTLVRDVRQPEFLQRGALMSDAGDRSSRDAAAPRSHLPPEAACVVPGAELTDARAAEPEHLRKLLRRISSGDRAAFTQLYDTTAARVYGLVLRVLRDPGFSEDTTQEIFLQVWDTASSYNPDRGSPLAWLLTLAHRRAIDRVRAEQSGADREARYGPALHSVPHDEVAESVTQRLEAEEVVHCLSTLTDLQVEAVQMAYYGGLTYREVADRLGVAVPTVKTRMRDGLTRLGKCLGVARSE